MERTIAAFVNLLGFILLMIAPAGVIFCHEARNDLGELYQPGQHLIPAGGKTIAHLRAFSFDRRKESLNFSTMPVLPPSAERLKNSILNSSRSAGVESYIVDTVAVVSTYDTTRYAFGHNSSGSVISISVNKWTNGQWVDSCRYLYGTIGYMLTESFDEWTNSQWVNVDSTTYTFDPSGNELAQMDEQWTNGRWVNVDSVAYTYDAFGNLFSVLEELWTSGQWVNDWRYTYTYDEYGNTSSILEESWTNGQWVNDRRYTNTTDSNGQTLSGVTEQWTNNQWVNVESTTYTYYGSGAIFTEVYEQWADSQWVNSDSTVFTYDANGNELAQSVEQWTNSQWVNSDSTTFTYGANGNKLTQLDEQWTNGKWIDVDRTTYAYGPNGLETSAKYEIWRDSLWVPADGDLYFSDGTGNYSYYDACNITTIYGSVGTGVISANVIPTYFSLSQNYPNPFNPSTIIQFTVPSNGHAVLKVFNVLGQEVVTLFEGEAAAGIHHQVEFNASNLASGIYFSRLEFGGQMEVKKMLLLK